MVKSKLSWKSLIYVFTALAGLFLFALTSFALPWRPTSFTLFTIFIGSVGIGCLLMMVFFAKKIIVDKDKVTIKYIFRNKSYTYNYKDILGYTEYLNTARGYQYESFQFKTTDGRVFNIMELEFSNYSSIKSSLTSNTTMIEIPKFYNWKYYLYISIASICLAVIVMVLIKAIKG